MYDIILKLNVKWFSGSPLPISQIPPDREVTVVSGVTEVRQWSDRRWDDKYIGIMSHLLLDDTHKQGMMYEVGMEDDETIICLGTDQSHELRHEKRDRFVQEFFYDLIFFYLIKVAEEILLDLLFFCCLHEDLMPDRRLEKGMISSIFYVADIGTGFIDAQEEEVFFPETVLQIFESIHQSRSDRYEWASVMHMSSRTFEIEHDMRIGCVDTSMEIYLSGLSEICSEGLLSDPLFRIQEMLLGLWSDLGFCEKETLFFSQQCLVLSDRKRGVCRHIHRIRTEVAVGLT